MAKVTLRKTRETRVRGGHPWIYASEIEKVEGEFENGASHGRGVLRYPDGKVYEGQFRCGDPSGHGILRYPDGSVLEGEFQYGMANGHGVLRYPDGRVYEGEFRDGDFIG